MKEQHIHKTDLTEKDRHYLAAIGSHLLNNKQKDRFLAEGRKVVYSGQLTNVHYLGEDTFEYTIDGHLVQVVFPLEQSVRISRERPKALTDAPIWLEGLPLNEENSILLLQLTYPEQANEDSLEEDHQMEMPESTKNMILHFTEGFKFCAFIFAILFTGQLFDDNDPERYRIVTYVAGGCLLAFIYGYFYIASRKKSWLRPVPVMHFKGRICQILRIIDNSGDISSDEVMYITGDRTFITWQKIKDIRPGNEVIITFKPFSNVGFRKVDKPDVQEIRLV